MNNDLGRQDALFSWKIFSCFCYREIVKKQSLDLICNSYKQMYDMISDPVNEYREPLTIVPRTPDQVIKLLA